MGTSLETRLNRLIVRMNPALIGSDKGLILYLVPPDVDIQTLQIRMEAGGLVFRDERRYKEWDGCFCDALTEEELAQAHPAQERVLPSLGSRR